MSKSIVIDTTLGVTDNHIFTLGEILKSLKPNKWTVKFEKPQITWQQMKSIHLFCEWLAVEFNEKDMYYKEEYLGKNWCTEWTKELIKEKIWRRFMIALTGKDSCKKLTTKEVGEIADYITKNLSKELGIILNFPNRAEMNRVFNG